MKLSTLRGEVTVPTDVKRFALVLAIIDGMYCGDREKFLRRLVHYYGVTL